MAHCQYLSYSQMHEKCPGQNLGSLGGSAGLAAVGRYYGLALELQTVPSKIANNFSVLVGRPNLVWTTTTDCSIELRIDY